MSIETYSLRAAANLALNALHECIVPKSAESQISDAIRALRSAIDASHSSAESEDGNLPAIQAAYGYLWHVNATHEAPSELKIPTIQPIDAAFEARKYLRELLTREQRGHGINSVREAIASRANQEKSK